MLINYKNGETMGKIFITSDTHFNHTNIIKYCSRPFSSVAEMNSTLIDNWNSVVSKDDLVIHLGDFAWGRTIQSIKQYLDKLNGDKILIIGNHDELSQDDYIKCGFSHVYSKLEVNLYNNFCVFCHFQLLHWNKSEHGSIHFYGHQHRESNNDEKIAALNASNRRFNAGIDLNNYTPVNLYKVIQILKEKPTNAPWVK